MGKSTYIVLILALSWVWSMALASALLNLTLPGQHPDPEAFSHEVLRKVNSSIHRRMLQDSDCATGNPIDDCWRCDPDWSRNRQRLADCGIGFGQYALGGKGGQYYVVTDSSDNDAVNPKPGTLRYAVIQTEPLWIVFSSNMVIKLSEELIFNSYKTLDGRGADIKITGGGCLTIQDISNIIIHNIHIHHCYPSGNANVRASPTHYGRRGLSDGDGISISGSKDIWIDHCSLSHCKDGLIDVVLGSTSITVSNNHFSHHNEVMLLGHSDDYEPDTGMQVTIAFNIFGKNLIQRMPRCRKGYIHVLNNDYTQWEMYAIGGSGNPTINSQGNRYIAPGNPFAKEVTKRVTGDKDWKGWNWRSEGDLMVNGAFFVASGAEATVNYEKASGGLAPRSAEQIDQLTGNAGVFGSRRTDQGKWTTDGPGGGADLNSDDDDDYDYDYDQGGYISAPSILLSILLFLLGLSF